MDRPAGPRGLLGDTLDAWALEAAVASQFLAVLYRALGDGAQAALALRAGQPAAERVQRARLQPGLAPLQAAFRLRHPEEATAEAAAWRGLVTALAGTSVFLSMAADGTGRPEPGLRGQRNACARALDAALRGYRAGFPDTSAAAGTRSALQEAARLCAQVFLADPGADPGAQAAVADCERTILEGLQTTVSNPRPPAGT